MKERYATADGRVEVAVAGFRVDAVDGEGRLVEVQAGPLAALRPKLVALLESHRVRVIKPIAASRRIIRRDRADGPDRSRRRSPKTGALLDVFDEFVAIARLFPDPNLTIEVVEVEIDEIRVARGRSWTVADRRLVEVGRTEVLREADDLWSLVPADLDGPFTTFDLARVLGRPLAFAQRLAYCLKHAGAVEDRGVSNRRRLYRRIRTPALAPT